VSPDPFSRRRFLAVGGGAALLAACGSTKSASNGAPNASDDHFTQVAPGIVSIDLYASPKPQRFAFALTAKEGFASGVPVRVAIAPPGSKPTHFVTADARGKGLPDFRGVYSIDATLDQAGIWSGMLDYQGTKSRFVFQVPKQHVSPIAGDPAPRAASPTVTNTLGVHPICTRVPQCPLHTTSLADLIGKGRPVAVMFATPARCQTRYCGPVLDTLLKLRPEYQDQIDFVHVEIYKNDQTTDLIPTVDAWGPLTGEPWLFGVDKTGVVTGRLDGAFDQTEMDALLKQLVS
jgi:hypothetical protein